MRGEEEGEYGHLEHKVIEYNFRIMDFLATLERYSEYRDTEKTEH